MNLLTLDISSHTGFALDADDIDTTDNPEYGSIKFAGSLGERAFAFENWLVQMVKGRNVGALAIEAPVPVRGTTNLDSQLWLYGASTIARKVCVAHKIKLIVVNVVTWRSYFIGQPHAPKDIKAAHARKKWLKTMTIATCHERGWDPRDDNAADALGILDYCLTCFDPKNGLDNPADLYAEAA